MAFLKDVDTTDWFTGRGIMIYDPRRGAMKNRTEWWAVVELDRSITDYYRWWANKYINPLRYTEEDRYKPTPDGKNRTYTWHELKDKREDLLEPAWGAHMSIIRGEKPRPELMHLWKKYHGQEVEFKYSNNVRFSGDTGNTPEEKVGVYWFVDAVCDVGKTMRDELRLPSNWTFHITVGRTNE